MMLGPMKKKMITTGVIAFLIPTIVIGVMFGMYAKNKKTEIAELKVKAETQMAYVLAGDLPVNHIMSENDVTLVEAKKETLPSDAYLATEILDKNGNPTKDKKGNILYNYDKSFVGRKLKSATGARTILSDALFLQDSDNVSVDLRSREFNMISLPSNLVEGDFIDIRILFPTGEDYLVVAGKEIMSTGANAESNSIFLELNEEEIVRVSSAVIESYIADGINVYATKYVNPTEQLYKYVNVDYVAKYNDAVKKLQELYKENVEVTDETTARPMVDASGDPVLDENGNQMYTEATTKVEEKVPTEDELDLAEIVREAGCQMTEDDAKAIREAKAKKDNELLKFYENKTEVYSKALTPNYPVRPEVAKMLAENPNLMDEIRAKYADIEKLEAQRANLINTSTRTIDEMTGLEVEDPSKTSKVAQNLTKEIEAQRADRKEYLQTLIREAAISNANSAE